MKWTTKTDGNGYVDPEDMFADTRMTFGEHIEDLRTHLLRAIKGFILALIVSFFIGKPILNFIAAPVERQMNAFQARYNKRMLDRIKNERQAGWHSEVPPVPMPLRVLRDQMRDPRLDELLERENGKNAVPEKVGLDVVPQFKHIFRELGVGQAIEPDRADDRYVDLIAEIPDPVQFYAYLKQFETLVRPVSLSTLSVTEAFVVYFKVCLMTGLVLGSPWIFYQIWAFVAAGLYPHEKKYVNYFLPVSLGLFLIGVFVCELLVMTKAVEALLWFNEWLGLQPDLRLNEWLGFAIFMPLVFGISFQTPLVMLFLQRVGIFTVDAFRAKRRMAIFLMAIFAAIITPSTDPVSMGLLWGPMCLLYELGIAMCIFLPGKPLIEFDMPETEELVEV
jgi:sec-independent protein translocase protein TatC